ncbi:MAG: 4-hydroxybenzoate octaprenyltransferase, partial [Elusimicrobia bacterium]|nr:4-hydroxybenzoate octaprenyltransferase [Elusimicrobiota bacterium]
MTALLELMRPFVCLAAAGGAFAGGGAAGFPPTDYLGIVLTTLSAFFMMGAACTLNDVYDADIDA